MVPDLDGDGIDDLVVGTSGANTVYVHLGPVSGQRDLGDSDFDFTGSTGGRLAMALAAPGDIDGDGWNDILLNRPGHLFDGGTYPYTGQAYLFLGPITADRTAEDASAELYLGPGHDESLLGRSACTGDIDGDGLLDVALGAPGAGRKHSTVLNDSGDANGDGRADILIGAPHNNDDEDSNGAVFIFYGSVTGTAELSGIGRSSTPRDLPATPRISNPSRFFTPSERRGPYPTRFTRGPAESSALVPSVVVTSTRPRTTLRWVGLGTAG